MVNGEAPRARSRFPCGGWGDSSCLSNGSMREYVRNETGSGSLEEEGEIYITGIFFGHSCSSYETFSLLSGCRGVLY